MTPSEALDRVKVLWNTGASRPYSCTERDEIEKMYDAVLGRHIRTCNCSEKWRDAVVEMYSYLKKNGKMHTKSNYILKAGVVIQPAGTSEVYTNANLTDKVAAAFLAEHPLAAGLFEHIPDAPSKAAESAEPAETVQEETDLNPAVKSAIAEALASGASKTKIRTEFAGREIDGVKLTQRLVAAYIKAIENNE